MREKFLATGEGLSRFAWVGVLGFLIYGSITTNSIVVRVFTVIVLGTAFALLIRKLVKGR